MILLDGHSLAQVRRVPLEALSLQLNERNSSASMTPTDMTGITVGAWMQDDTEPGKGIVWRVKSIGETWATKTPRLQLEHAVRMLQDRILFGEHKAPQITGEPSATTATAEETIEYILSFQSDWVLGDFDYTGISNPYKFDGDNLLDALEQVSNSLEDSWWTYDFTVYPFRLNIVQKSEDVGTVLRCGRNITALSKNIDKGGMFTRFYPIGKDDLNLPEQYVERNTSLYGIVSKVETDQSIDSETELRRWANERLSKHAEPVVTIEVDGLELSAATGEELDQLKLGEKCRIPMSEFGGEITETITQLTYNDKIHQPEVVRISLANNQTDIIKFLADELKRGGKGGRGSAKQKKEDNAWFEDTKDHVAMCAKGIIGVDAAGNPNWIELANLIVDGTGIHQTVTEVQGDVVRAFAQIDVASDRILMEVQNNVDNLHSEITQTAGQIRTMVENTLDEFYTEIIQEASQIVIRTGDATKTFKSLTAPTGTQQDPLVDGDLWFESEGEFTWGEAAGRTWIEDAGRTWADAVAAKVHRYNGTTGQWEKVNDTYTGILMQDTRIEATKESIRQMAGRVDYIDGQAHAHYAEFKVSADQIHSQVNDYYNGLSSAITQTAGQIRAEVSDTKNELQSSITVESNRIGLIVEGTGENAHIKPAQIVAAINDGESSILISADHIDLDGYVKATDITSNFIASKISAINSLSVNNVTAGSVRVATGSSSSLVATEAYVNGCPYNLRITQDGNTYTLQWQRLGYTGWSDVGSFSRAITSATASWSDGQCHMRLQPQNQTFNANLPSAGTWSRTNNAPGSYTIRCTVAGKTYSQTWNDFHG